MRTSVLFVFLGLSFTILAGCKNAADAPASSGFRAAIVLDKGGIDDQSFNASAVRGAERAKKELGMEVKVVEITDDQQIEPALKNFAQKKYDLIISIGFAQTEFMKKTAAAYPEAHFAIVDGVVDLPNVASLEFAEHEGSYLAGALAAAKSKTGVVGFIGGMDIPLIRRFELGYREGALQKRLGAKAATSPAAKPVKILTSYIGVTGEAWSNPTKGKELALSQISQKADVIFSAAGASGQGVFDAVEEVTKKNPKAEVYAIGVDSNQNGVEPGLILTSMLKRVDNAIFESIRLAKEGKYSAGKKNFGLKDQGIDLAFDRNNQNLVPESWRAQLEILKNDIIKSRVVVSDYYKKH